MKQWDAGSLNEAINCLMAHDKRTLRAFTDEVAENKNNPIPAFLFTYPVARLALYRAMKEDILNAASPSEDVTLRLQKYTFSAAHMVATTPNSETFLWYSVYSLASLVMGLEPESVTIPQTMDDAQTECRTLHDRAVQSIAAVCVAISAKHSNRRNENIDPRRN